MKILPTSYVQQVVRKPTTIKQIVNNVAPTIRKALFVPLVATSTALITPSCEYFTPPLEKIEQTDINTANKINNFLKENYLDKTMTYSGVICNTVEDWTYRVMACEIEELPNGNKNAYLKFRYNDVFIDKEVIGGLAFSKDGEIMNREDAEIYNATEISKRIGFINKYSDAFIERQRQEQEKARIEAERQRIEAQQKALNNYYQSFLEIPLFDDLKNTDYPKFFKAVGVSNFEYTKNPNGVYNIFVDKGGYNYDISLKQVDNTTSYAGLAKKLLKDGTSEIYIFKTDFFSTNKSDKFRISQMRVVQDGISDDAPVQKKKIKETIKTGENTTDINSDYKGQKKVDMLLPLIPNIFAPGSHTNGNISAKAINTINEIITEINCEGKIVTVYSSPKGSNVIERNGMRI